MINFKEIQEVCFVDPDTSFGTVRGEAVTAYPAADRGLRYLREDRGLGHGHQFDRHGGREGRGVGYLRTIDAAYLSDAVKARIAELDMVSDAFVEV